MHKDIMVQYIWSKEINSKKIKETICMKIGKFIINVEIKNEITNPANSWKNISNTNICI